MSSSDILISKGYIWDNVRCNTHEEALLRAKRFRQAGRFATVLRVTGSAPCWKVFTRGKKIKESSTLSFLKEDIFLSGHLIPMGTNYEVVDNEVP